MLESICRVHEVNLFFKNQQFIIIWDAVVDHGSYNVTTYIRQNKIKEREEREEKYK